MYLGLSDAMDLRPVNSGNREQCAAKILYSPSTKQPNPRVEPEQLLVLLGGVCTVGVRVWGLKFN